MLNKSDYKELNEKIQIGLKLYHKRLLEEKRKNNEELIISRNGKIVRLKPSEFPDVN